MYIFILLLKKKTLIFIYNLILLRSLLHLRVFMFTGVQLHVCLLGHAGTYRFVLSTNDLYACIYISVILYVCVRVRLNLCIFSFPLVKLCIPRMLARSLVLSYCVSECPVSLHWEPLNHFVCGSISTCHTFISSAHYYYISNGTSSQCCVVK